MANWLYDVRPSKVEVRDKFEFTTEDPIFQKLRQVPKAYNEIIRNEVTRILEVGIITPVESAWTSPVVLSSKKVGSPRFRLDFRRLNAMMKRDRWPIPRFDAIFHEVKWFTTIDLFQVYWKTKVEETCKEKTTFICRYGT